MPPQPADIWLLVVAARVEARALLAGLEADPDWADRQWQRLELTPSFDLVISGVGKANAAAATALAADPHRHSAIVSLGVAGALPGSGLAIGDCLASTASIYGDEGILTPEAFMDCAAMGFPLIPPEASRQPCAEVFAALRSIADRQGPIATISTCSGIDPLAEQVQKRTGALAECMEGAAVAHIACRLGIPYGELRVISNTTGDRPRQRWDLPAALARLQRAVRELAALRRGVR